MVQPKIFYSRALAAWGSGCPAAGPTCHSRLRPLHVAKDSTYTNGLSMTIRGLLIRGLLLLAALAVVASAGHAAVQPDHKGGLGRKWHVLYINSYQNGYTWSDTILDGIRETLAGSGLPIDLQVEYLDAKKHPEPAVREELRRLFLVKFADVAFDSVIVSDNDAFSFALENRQELFPGVPLVFCGINDFDPAMLAGQADVTGVGEAVRAVEILETAVRLHPGRDRLLVIGDHGTTSVAIEQDVRDAEPYLKGRLAFEYVRVNSLEELAQTVERAGKRTMIFLIPFYMDEGGAFLNPQEVTERAAGLTSVPIHSGWLFQLGHGIVGGRLLSGHHQGRLAAGMALDILSGKPASEIPIQTQTEDLYYFDKTVLDRFDLTYMDLPAGSRLINQPPPFYELEKPLFWIIMASLAALTLLLFVLALNIRQRKAAERKLKDQLHFMELLMDTIPAPVYFRARNGVYKDFNKAFQRWFGADRDEAVATLRKGDRAGSGSRLRSPTVLSDEADQELLAEPGVRIYEQVLESADGRLHHVLVHKATYCNARGDVEGLVGVLYDFTDRKKAEEKYRSIFENSALGIFRLTTEGAWLDANPAIARMLGHATPAELMASGCSILEDMRCPELEAILPGASGNAKKPGATSFECRLTRSDGQELAVRAYLRAVASHLEGTVEDVTSHRKAERDLRDSQKMLRMVLDNIPQIVYWKDRKLRFMGANKSFADFFGLHDASEVIGKLAADILDHELRALPGEQLDHKVMLTNRPSQRMPIDLKQAGGLVTLEVTKLPLHDHEGQVIGVLSTAEDVTRKLSLERQLLQSQKMEAIGTFVSGIAHDFNNILTTIINSAELALLDLPEKSEPAVDVRRALSAAHQGSTLVRQIHTYSRPTREGFQPTDVAAAVREALDLLRASLPGNIRLMEDLEPGLGICLADPTQVRQIVMNLCTNSFQALRDSGGVIEVSLRQEQVTPERADLLGLQACEHLRLSVSDNGPGIEPDIAHKIFDPFFTTKSLGEGTGLGLAVVQGIVKGHKGGIHLSSEPWSRTCFDIHLPHMSEEALPLGLGELPAPPGSERILFVEDDPDQLAAIPKILGRLGYDVLPCRSVDVALEALSSGSEFDLAITDFDMPDVTGVDFARALHQIRPGLPVILVSGRHGAAHAAQGVDNIRQVLPKPYSGKSLSAAIRSILDNAALEAQPKSGSHGAHTDA